MPNASTIAAAREILSILHPRQSLERERAVDLAITPDGRPRTDRATGVLAAEARPGVEADQVFVDGVDHDDLQAMVDALSLDDIQAQIDLKAPLASPTFTGTVTAVDLTTTGNSTLGNGDGDITKIQGHLKHKSAAPSASVGAALGTGGSVGVVIVGTDQAGKITLTTGTTSLTTGTASLITLVTARPDTNYTLLISPASQTTGTNAVQVRATIVSTTQWAISYTVAPASGSVYVYHFAIIEWTN